MPDRLAEHECNGLCVMASDLIDFGSHLQVAYAHDGCSLHGIPDENEIKPPDVPNFDYTQEVN